MDTFQALTVLAVLVHHILAPLARSGHSLVLQTHTLANITAIAVRWMMEWFNTHFLYSFSSITASLNIHKYWTHTVQRKLTSCTAGQWQISSNNQWPHVWRERPQMLRNRNGVSSGFLTIYPSLKCLLFQWLYKTSLSYSVSKI